jgi:D-alanine-D-alanine ligase
MKDRRIGVLRGGHNAEHEVSLETGAMVAKGLRGRGYHVIEIDMDQELPQRLRREQIEVAFIALHGRYGEDGCVQGLLEVMRIPYTGSGVLASALSMDKVMAKKLFRAAGLMLAEDVVLSKNVTPNYSAADLPFPLPVVVKPGREGSSVGVNIARDETGFHRAIAEAGTYAGDILIERYLKGREIQVAILDDRALGAIEIIPAEDFYNYRAKYVSDSGTRYVFPASLSEDETRRARAAGLGAHRALGCHGVTRVDLIFSQGEFFVLEVNTLPGMTAHSLVPMIAAGIGISFEELVERILMTAALKA